MDFHQRKLTRAEWQSVEVPVSDEEKRILELIVHGYSDPHIRTNRHTTLYTVLKIQPSAEMDEFLYRLRFEKILTDLHLFEETTANKSNANNHNHNNNNKPTTAGNKKKKTSSNTIDIKRPEYPAYYLEWLRKRGSSSKSAKMPNKADMIRIENSVTFNTDRVFEYALIRLIKAIVFCPTTTTTTSTEIALYGLLHMCSLHVVKVHSYIMDLVRVVLENSGLTEPETISRTFEQADRTIEHNPTVSSFQDDQLYAHQTELFELFASSSNTTNPSNRHKFAREREKQNVEDQDQDQENKQSMCVLYMAPTGTGKTMSPLGLSEQYRVIFVCVARHVGLALAKSAISVGKRIAFAFGAETADDIRLHYFAAADYTVNRKSGGIGKVDNSNGSRVEIMICDVASYLVAMYYMKSFHGVDQLVTYWDEPTISMDYESHELHPILARNWRQNQIPRMVLSCATLPRADEIAPVVHDFRCRFPGATIHTVNSYDCKKTITLLNKEGRVALPHFLFASYQEIMECAEHCLENKSLLRYFDVKECVRFIREAERRGFVPPALCIRERFRHVEDLHLLSIKLHYLEVLQNLTMDDPFEDWPRFHTEWVEQWDMRFSFASSSSSAGLSKYHSMDSSHSSTSSSVNTNSNTNMNTNDNTNDNGKDSERSGEASFGKPLRRLQSVALPSTTAAAAAVPPKKQVWQPSDGILLTTKDAHTLTDGPTIYLAEDVEKVGKFFLQQSHIPDSVFDTIRKKMNKNESLLRQIASLEREFQEAGERDKTVGNKSNNNNDNNNGGKDKDKAKERLREKQKDDMNQEQRRLDEQIGQLRSLIQTVRLNSTYVPNTMQHQDLWLPSSFLHSVGYVKNAFVPNVDDEDVKEIMALDGVSNQRKLLLMLGIGVFDLQPQQQQQEGKNDQEEPEPDQGKEDQQMEKDLADARHQKSNEQYVEIMKRLAYNQCLFMIIASSDYIYGTNYQFCHGFLGKDLANMTQQKIIQAIGRIGRRTVQQEYTVRVRDDGVLRKLFQRMDTNLEAQVMTRLFCMSGKEEEEEE